MINTSDDYTGPATVGLCVDTDWIGLWWDLATAFQRHLEQENNGRSDRWSQRARPFDASVKRRREENDPLRDFVLNKISGDTTLLDIGAGTGSWALPVAQHIRQVTALEPSESMRNILLENLAECRITNVTVIAGRWEGLDIEQHDYVLCSHAMYTSPDIIGFARKMEQAARRACFMLMRLPSANGVMAELSRRLRGHPHDSPNFIVGYNALIVAGFCPNVMIERGLRPWHNATLEDAFQRVRRHLRLADDNYDTVIRATLERRLVRRGGEYWWPDGMRSALIWWEPDTTLPRPS
jgi:2-polyprenyl-3-methyl-5-hydroxy-6-metoxy-1,4-benzoquinol methylase